MFKPRLHQQEQGFTLVEVLVAILLTVIFTVVAMQAIVVATVFKVRAKQFAEATIWIQEDLEAVKRQSALLKSASLAAAPIVGATTLSVYSLNGLASDDLLKVGTDTATYTIQSVDSTTTPPTVTLATPPGGLASDQPQDAEIITTPPLLKSASLAAAHTNSATLLSVYSLNGLAPTDVIKVGTATGSYTINSVNSTVTPPTITINPGLTSAQSRNAEIVTTPPSSLICNANASTSGFGNLLIGNLTALSNGGIKIITGKTYTLVRTPIVKPTAPFEVVKLSYTVAEGSKPPIATLNTEVIPDAFFRCT